MDFFRKLFKSNTPNESENYFSEEKHESKKHFLTQEEEYVGYNVDMWVNNEIPALDEEIAHLIYQKDLDENTIHTFLGYRQNSDLGQSSWTEKGMLNFPGPFYTSETDTCGTGICEAPLNVLIDEHYMEHVMIQPRTKNELWQVCNAGAVEIYSAYHCDGNQHWTVQLVRDWWKNKDDLLAHLKHQELIKHNCNQDKRYAHYLQHQAKLDLRKYCFFLENGFYPSHEKLPELD
ncbi:hypothetical protein SAMN05421823_107129 [Catalinimonas alkaloidigena]|uniref:Uncharacterized protein n=1 Tax=Catalinimonas alkaloidigena TaxID=1075417 RepID=A0A1G9LQ06_9BACT|nr:hypothetical protein [Catalinimonas alkaloidigena]SDL63998.1 hypothetical protein SAMN05421823_107129 [Catalinimonas alkaloidigena]